MMPLLVQIPCTHCGHSAWLAWEDWLNRWPYVCRACQAPATAHRKESHDKNSL